MSLTDCVSRFFPLFSSYIYNLITAPETLRTATLSVLKDFHADGVTYLELRTTPRSLPSPTPQPPSVYVSTILSAIAEFEAAHPGPETMRTRLILSVDRRHTPAQADETVRLAAQFRDQGVVGVDLCGDPAARCHGVDGQDNISIFRGAFAEAKRLGLGLTIHFGEAECSGHPDELAEILSWGPGRLGHVIHLGEDVKKEITAKKIGLELCLSCNVHAGMVTGGFEGHHFGEWWGVEGSVISLGVSFCCCSFTLNAGSQRRGSCVWMKRNVFANVVNRQMMWVFLAARYRTSTGWWLSISTCLEMRFAHSPDGALTPSLAETLRSSAFKTSCGERLMTKACLYNCEIEDKIKIKVGFLRRLICTYKLPLRPRNFNVEAFELSFGPLVPGKIAGTSNTPVPSPAGRLYGPTRAGSGLRPCPISGVPAKLAYAYLEPFRLWID